MISYSTKKGVFNDNFSTHSTILFIFDVQIYETMLINGSELDQLTWQFFRKHLKLQGRTYYWLAENMGYGYPYTYRLLNGKKPLTENHKQILIELLEIPVVSKVTENT